MSTSPLNLPLPLGSVGGFIPITSQEPSWQPPQIKNVRALFQPSNISRLHPLLPVSVTLTLTFGTFCLQVADSKQGPSHAPNGQIASLFSSLNTTASQFDTALTTNLSLLPPLWPAGVHPLLLPTFGWPAVSPHLTPQHNGCEGVQLHCSLTLEAPSPKFPIFSHWILSLLCLCCLYPSYVLKYLLFAVLPWESWKAPQNKKSRRCTFKSTFDFVHTLTV